MIQKWLRTCVVRCLTAAIGLSFLNAFNSAGMVYAETEAELTQKVDSMEADLKANGTMPIFGYSRLVNRAKFYEDAGKMELAEADWNRAVQLKPESCLGERARFYELVGKMELAEADWNQAVQLAPYNLQGRAKFYEKVGKMELAEADLNKAVQRCPEDNLIDRARFYELVGKMELAEADWNRGVQLKPKDYLQNYANFLEKVGKIGPAEAAWNRAVQMEPFCLVNRALFYARAGKLELAEADLNRAVQQSESYLIYRAEFYEEIGKMELAEADMNRAVQLQPDSAPYFRALFNERAGKLELAEADWNKAAQNNQIRIKYRAKFYERQGKFELALRDFDSLYTNGRSECAIDRALLLIRMGKKQLAERDLKEIISLRNKNYEPDSETLAECYLALGQPKLAVDSLAKFQLPGRSPSLVLAIAYDQINKGREAAILYAKLISETHRIARSSIEHALKCEYARKRLAALGVKSAFGPFALASKCTIPIQETLTLGTASTITATANNITSTTSPATVSTTDATTLSSEAGKIGTNGAVDRPIRDKWAVIVGVSKFKDSTIPKLKFPAKDARDFYNFLTTKANFKADHVRLLTDEIATRERIWTEVGDTFLPRVVGPDDLVVLYFSTHGSSPDRDVRKNNYLIAYDTPKSRMYADGIKMQDIVDELNQRTGADRVLIVLDACHSGAADPNAKALDFNTSVDIDKFAVGSGHIILTSSESSESSYESDHDRNGIFTKQLIRVLSSNSKIIESFSSLKDSVSDQARQEFGKRQTPRLKADSWAGRDLLLSAPATHPRTISATVKKLLEPDSTAATPALALPRSKSSTTSSATQAKKR